MPDNAAGPRGAGFPTTRWSAVQGARSEDSAERDRSWEALVGAYWKPVYKYVRVRWHRTPEDAQDLTQEFFLRAMQKDFFSTYDPARARFRTFVRTCLDGYAANERILSPENFVSTIYRKLGIDPGKIYHTPQGRPVYLVTDPNPIAECMG